MIVDVDVAANRPRVQDQGLCATCVNAAIASAAEAAVAAAAGISTQAIALSSVYAYYCKPTMVRSCSSGWSFKEALQGLLDSARTFLPAAACTNGFDFGALRGSSPTKLTTACDDVYYTCSSEVLQDCDYQNLTDFWAIQRAIRVHGAVVTRVTMHSALINFFRENPRGVYNETSNRAPSGIPHAVVLVSRFCLQLDIVTVPILAYMLQLCDGRVVCFQ
jgi:hypothetical protein